MKQRKKPSSTCFTRKSAPLKGFVCSPSMVLVRILSRRSRALDLLPVSEACVLCLLSSVALLLPRTAHQRELI